MGYEVVDLLLGAPKIHDSINFLFRECDVNADSVLEVLYLHSLFLRVFVAGF